MTGYIMRWSLVVSLSDLSVRTSTQALCRIWPNLLLTIQLYQPASDIVTLCSVRRLMSDIPLCNTGTHHRQTPHVRHTTLQYRYTHRTPPHVRHTTLRYRYTSSHASSCQTYHAAIQVHIITRILMSDIPHCNTGTHHHTPPHVRHTTLQYRHTLWHRCTATYCIKTHTSCFLTDDDHADQLSEAVLSYRYHVD